MHSRTLKNACLSLALDPAFVARLKDLIGLWRRHSGVLLRGRFLETEPLEHANPALVARAYESPVGRAVSVWNPSSDPQPLTVRWPGLTCRRLETPGPNAPLSVGDPLPPGGVAVMLFQ